MRVLLLSILLLACPALAEPSAQLIEQLRAGGYVLYLRHTSTDFSQNDSRMTSYEDCASQRNLTDQGRDEARAIGEHVKRLKIPIGEVLASPFCRTMETARLAFGKARATNEARGGPARTDDPARYAPLRKLLSSTYRKARTSSSPATATRSMPLLARPSLPKAKSRWCGPKRASASP